MKMKSGWLDLRTGMLYGKRVIIWSGLVATLAASTAMAAKPTDLDPNSRGPIISGPKK